MSNRPVIKSSKCIDPVVGSRRKSVAEIRSTRRGGEKKEGKGDDCNTVSRLDRVEASLATHCERRCDHYASSLHKFLMEAWVEDLESW